MNLLPIALFLGLLVGDEPARPIPIDESVRLKLREVAFKAAREGDVKTLDAYFQAGQPADVVNARGDTLLILAAYYGQEEAVRTILAQPERKVDARNEMGFTALTGAAFKGHLGIVKQLVAKGADPNAVNARKQTPLMFASMFGRAEVVSFLIESRADPEIRDDRGRTALMLAKEQGNAAVEAILQKAKSSSH